MDEWAGDFKKKLDSLLLKHGVDFWGGVAVEQYENMTNDKKKESVNWLLPSSYFPEGNMKTVAVLGKSVLKGNLKNPGKYTARHNITVNEQLNCALLEICRMLDGGGYETFGQFTIVQNFSPPDDYRLLQSDVVPSKIIAKMADLGNVGWHNLFIHKIYGARVRLTTLITEAEPDLFQDTNIKGDAKGASFSAAKECDQCYQCVKSCPVKAISRSQGYDANQCWKYNHSLQQKWGYSGCGRCMYHCK